MISVAAASEANAPREYLDEETRASVFLSAGRLYSGVRLPLSTGINSKVVRARPDAAPEMTLSPRNYVSLAAAAVDRSGKFSYVLIGYFRLVGMPEPLN